MPEIEAPAADWQPPAWDELVREYSPQVYRLAYRLTGQRADAEDLTQEVFIRVFRSLDSYQPGTFSGWLHRITTNLFLDQVRRKQRQRTSALGEYDSDAPRAARGDEPERHFEMTNLDVDIQTALAALAPEYRAAVVLRDIEDLTYEEIAEVLGISLGTVRSRIHRGRAKLRTALAHRSPSAPSTPAAPLLGGLAPAGAVIGPFGHLGPLASGLVDDTLAPEERRRALEHLEHCADCDRLVAEQRRQRRLTATLGQVSVPTGLADRLLALGAAEGAGAAGGASVAPWSQTPDVRRRSAGRFVLVSAASVVGLGVVASGVLYGIGAPRVRTPEAIAQAAVSVDATSAVALSGATDSSADPGAAWPAGFSAPANLSASALTVTGTTASDTDAGDIVQVELDVDGETVTLLESHGMLDVDAGSVSRSVRVGDVEAHRVGQWWVAQAGTDVVAVRGSDDACLTVLRSFSTSTPTFPAAVLDRMGAGWRVVTGD